MIIAAYGSLRRGEDNYQNITDRYGRDSLKFLGEKRLSGYALIDISIGYPYAIKVENPVSKIVVEYLEVSRDADFAIKTMEETAGYTEHALDKNSIIYLFDNIKLIQGGDWVKYNKREVLDNVNGSI